MSDTTWTDEDSAALRLLIDLGERAEWPAEREQARAKLQREAPRYLRSLLDELERVTRERDEAQATISAVIVALLRSGYRFSVESP